MQCINLSLRTKKLAIGRKFCRCLSSSTGFCTTLTDDQLAFQSLTRKFARDKIIPAAAVHDKSAEYPHDLFNEAHSLGIVNAHIPESCGGLGLHTMEGCIIAEEIAYGCSAVDTSITANTLAQMPVILGGSDEQKKRFLGRCIEEPIKVAYAVSESGAGSDVAALETKAARNSDGDYVINGSKMWITNGFVAQESGGWYFVLAKTDPSASAGKSMTGFVVEANSPGIVVGEKLMNMGQRCSDTRPVFFEDVGERAMMKMRNGRTTLK